MRDTERLGVRNWRSKAKNRDGWRRLLESAKTLHGLQRGVMRNAERLGVRNWRSKAKDRDGWRRLLESAKTMHGL